MQSESYVSLSICIYIYIHIIDCISIGSKSFGSFSESSFAACDPHVLKMLHRTSVNDWLVRLVAETLAFCSSLATPRDDQQVWE